MKGNRLTWANGLILLELKAAAQTMEKDEAQLLSYLKSSKIGVGYVLNFDKSAAFKRMLFDNDRKGSLAWTKK